MAREQTPQPGDVVKRHRLATRLWHWTNALALLIMLMSGLMIFNAHPMLYWGEFGANADPAWLAIGDSGGNGYLRLGSKEIDTTGILGRWVDARGEIQTRAFPSSVTLPSGYSLADARLWHLAFAWVLALSLAAYMVWSLFSRHIQRDLRITAVEITPAHLWHDVKNHAQLRFPTGAAALRYNILQKLSYVGVIFLLLPAVILTGLTMSPGMDAAWHWLLSVFGGRQSARSLHFIAAMLLVAFVVVHLLMVVLAGPINEIRSMITGRYRLPDRRDNST
ncbi:MAG: cytochrome b/b6 domain-containing protein [Gammaproteobacteria bacterium]